MSFYTSLLRCDTYRPMQGRLIRRTTLVLLWLFIAAICQKIHGFAIVSLGIVIAGVATGTATAVGGWVAFRFLHHQPVADFLIDVQVESTKVSWCTWPELRRSTVVVLTAMAAFSIYLFACDISWQFVLKSLFVLNV